MGMSNLCKKFEDEIVHEGTFAQKTSNFVCAPCGRYQDIRHLFFLIQNFQGTAWASKITTYIIKLLSTGPLSKHIYAKLKWLGY